MTSNAYIFPGLKQTFKHTITPERVINACVEVYGITPDDLGKKTRKRDIAEPRQIAMDLIRFAVGKSTSASGFIFMKDHATVLHATRVVRNRMMYADFREKYDAICTKIGFK